MNNTIWILECNQFIISKLNKLSNHNNYLNNVLMIKEYTETDYEYYMNH